MELELNAQIREDIGGNKLKALREKGLIPAIIYGSGHKPMPVQVNYKEFEKVLEKAGESTILKLKIKNKKQKTGGETKNVLIHDVAKDPVSDKFIHIDFYQIRMDKPITTEVALVFEGEAPAVKNLDGVLVKNITEVEVEALPKDLPREIKVDLSPLETFDDHIRIKDLRLPEGVKALAEPEEMVVSVMPPRTEKELEELEEKPEEVVEEVEKVGEEKVEEEAEKGEEKKEEIREDRAEEKSK